ncbi:lycopene cyclase family protein [Streptantibioticus cattleyicolor]|uniref:Lycopene cyclase n=1 Tax=Streptantibioticus cattleyicolor (strain ATCC 35852 / DSM 46488 / JCM 4925 / NBRC 14057 / NRRL 8057) TaxID=1003195 RepID=F8JKV5_STREN|nr:lycopene cyclase family protein [Streptantibioticus cattleyicolor]AEW99690.1 lycopene cyclase [Streptantibioticus cattleyicolor NRRL 8057 = DSM 46488]CCB71272.1 putative lycopene cyclase [Streptantibioticus cattleyicolor NRRL 8057 = DSM 46488]
MRDAEVVVVGTGAAGLCLAYRLTDPALARRVGVLLVGAPPGELRPADRTWCYWEEGGGDFDGALTAVWDRLRVRGADGGAPVTVRPGPLRYKMLRSPDLERLVAGRLAAAPGARRVTAVVEEVRDDGGGVLVRGRTGDGEAVVWRARWAFDSRPPKTLPPARTTLVQHFQGWFVRSSRAVFDPDTAELMDFRTRQPRHGLSFGYVLPLGPCEALVEYTEFSAAPLDAEGYHDALDHYLHRVLGTGPVEVTATERGAIPMTDGRFPRRAGASVFRIGTAGGATRPATGYTFAAVQRQSRAVAAALAAGRVPVPPPPYPRRALAMDAVLLRALDTGRVDGPALLTGLFRRVPAPRLLRFLDGRTRLAEDIAVGLRTPVPPMLRTAVELPLLRRRPPAPYGPCRGRT